MQIKWGQAEEGTCQVLARWVLSCDRLTEGETGVTYYSVRVAFLGIHCRPPRDPLAGQVFLTQSAKFSRLVNVPLWATSTVRQTNVLAGVLRWPWCWLVRNFYPSCNFVFSQRTSDGPSPSALQRLAAYSWPIGSCQWQTVHRRILSTGIRRF